MECALPFGHGAFHLCDGAEGESHVWMGRRRTFLPLVEEVVVGAHYDTGHGRAADSQHDALTGQARRSMPSPATA